MIELYKAMLYVEPQDEPNDWVEHFSVPALSVGTYCIPAGGVDTQTPHLQDEIYVVASGRATLVTDDARTPVSAGSVLYVEANAAHQFVDITHNLCVLVVFAPAYSGPTK